MNSRADNYNYGAVRIALAIVLLVACGPGTSKVNEPGRVLEEYARALERGDHDAAYAMMSADFRKRHARDDFERLLREHEAELRANLPQLKGSPSRVEVEARLSYGNSEELRLVLGKDGRWHIASDPVDLYSQRTAREALRSFIRAVERRRYDIVLRFVPNRWAEAMTVEKIRKQWEGSKKDDVAGMLKSLKAALDAPIHLRGETAVMPYGERLEMRFVREDGVWKIEDPD